jgi:hypothetical protein
VEREIYDRYEGAHRLFIEYLTTMNQGERYDLLQIPHEQFFDFTHVAATTAYSLLAWIASKEETSVQEQIQMFAVTMYQTINEKREMDDD